MTALPIEYSQQNGFAVFTLNRPQALGAMNTPLLDTLDALLDRTEAAIRKAVRASGDLSLEAGLAVEYAVAMEVAESAQALGGLSRFRDKQPT